jgi:hypothetical protein
MTAAAPAKKAAAPARGDVPFWVVAVRTAGLFVLCGFIPIILGLPIGRRLFWTVAIAALPLAFTIAGYHVWRRVCPLAWFATLGRTLKVQGKRKVGEWMARNYFYVQFGVLATALAIRLTATNGTPWALAGFLVLVVAAATTIGFLYTGKTWCNYFCPVGLVEKIYNEPVPGRGTSPPNSQCTTCTACKKNCPDIDLELHHWKELDLPARHNVYFFWPGVVLAFYTYYYLVAGDWAYYFSGDWTREADQIHKALGPGFFFAPFIPRLVAAPLTLAAFAAASWVIFKTGETLFLRYVAKTDAEKQLVRHRARILAGLTAFLIFYSFAGQPTLRRLPDLVRHLIAIIVVFSATAVFLRRFFRKEENYVQEKFARGVLKRWEWGDAPPSDNLGDIYVLHTERTKQKEARLKAYKDTLSEMIADGVVSRNELALLDKLRHQLGVSDKDHEKILSALSAEAKQLLDPAYQGSVEKRLQREQYRQDLERIVMMYADRGETAPEKALEELRQQHRVSAEDHAAALAALKDSSSAVAQKLRETLEAAGGLRRAQRRAAEAKSSSSSVDFLAWLATWREAAHLERARSLKAMLGDNVALVLPEPPPDRDADAKALVTLAADETAPIRAAAAYLLPRFDDEASRKAAAALVADPAALVRETAVRALGARGRLTRDLVAAALADGDPRVVEAVMRAVVPRAGAGDATQADLVAMVASHAPTGGAAGGDAQFATLDPNAALGTLSTFEKMMLLRNVPLFAGLDPGDLEELSGITLERRFRAGDHLCREGEAADEVFLLISGKIEAWVGTPEKKQVLGQSEEGTVIGEMAAIDQGPRTAWCTALVETRALVVPGSEFQSLLDDRPAIAKGVIGVLSGRLRKMIEEKRT